MDDLKRAAAEYALTFVREGMILGLGSGSTAHEFVRLLAEKGPNVTAVATSRSTAELAGSLGIKLESLDDLFLRTAMRIELTVDGADEIAEGLSLIKGGGGDLFSERIVAAMSQEVLIIAEERKWVTTLGAFPLPIEVATFGVQTTMHRIVEMAAKLQFTLEEKDVILRLDADGKPFTTDQGNLICDCRFKSIANPGELYASLAAVPGVVESGLFVGVASRAVLAGEGGVRVLEAS